MSSAGAPSRELLRQQQLVRGLWRESTDDALASWLREGGERAAQGMAAYRSTAAAIAERALAAAYPTVRQGLGDESFAQLARAFWHHHPPQRGDLTHHGDALPAWIERDAQLAGDPYLADMARVDWAVHAIEHAADVSTPPPGLALLGELDPAQLRLHPRPGLTLLRSRWPVVTIWQVHRRDEPERMAPVRDALAAGVGETALVARDGWQATVTAVDEPTAVFFEALLQGVDLARALDAAGHAFAFDRWLADALRQQWLRGVERAA
jgi:hypothetical protein